MPTTTLTESKPFWLPRFLGGCTAIVAFVGAMLLFGRPGGTADDTTYSRRPERMANSGTLHTSLTRSQFTEAYWHKAVSPLHTIRFDGIRDSNESLVAYIERYLNQLQVAISTARAESTQDVDPELVEMVQRHLKIDDAALKINKVYSERLAQMASTPEGRRAIGKLSLADVFSKGLEAAQQPDAPADVKDAMQAMRQMQEAYSQMLHEIDIMQATLQERYRLAKTRFELPMIRPGVVKLPDR